MGSKHHSCIYCCFQCCLLRAVFCTGVLWGSEVSSISLLPLKCKKNHIPENFLQIVLFQVMLMNVTLRNIILNKTGLKSLETNQLTWRLGLSFLGLSNFTKWLWRAFSTLRFFLIMKVIKWALKWLIHTDGKYDNSYCSENQLQFDI